MIGTLIKYILVFIIFLYILYTNFNVKLCWRTEGFSLFKSKTQAPMREVEHICKHNCGCIKCKKNKMMSMKANKFRNNVMYNQDDEIIDESTSPCEKINKPTPNNIYGNVAKHRPTLPPRYTTTCETVPYNSG